MRPIASILALIVTLCASSGLSARPREVSHLEIRTAAGTVLPFTVEVADDDASRMLGLMFRRDLAADAGMLFVYQHDQVISMWMKNTYIPLDMLFLSRDGGVVSIVERTVPHSLTAISSPRPVRAVLELNGGTAARLGIRPGDRVLHPALGR